MSFLQYDAKKKKREISEACPDVSWPCQASSGPRELDRQTFFPLHIRLLLWICKAPSREKRSKESKAQKIEFSQCPTTVCKTVLGKMVGFMSQ
ncbi:hypothetical protein TNIN_339081 [Trichonephila inaurata madagascariensis]|uniref:Uncharacterized protein n=1 Tax=Trichonephila inaurata madagascariensis TaxID=2747483 RepID=A0A8X6IXD0_9ARAC|nr:hypothetical protein TNIN_339081 [Trichonephila inaurata madagascariensis]